MASNMALSGNGFFVTQSASGLPDYTRAGDFTTNKAGQITTPSGELLLGYPANNGVVNTAATLQPLQVGTGVTSPAVASTNFNISANLNASSVVGDTASSTLPVFDSLGAYHGRAKYMELRRHHSVSRFDTRPSGRYDNGRIRHADL
jgi:flagellar hook protein FlgE